MIKGQIWRQKLIGHIKYPHLLSFIIAFGCAHGSHAFSDNAPNRHWCQNLSDQLNTVPEEASAEELQGIIKTLPSSSATFRNFLEANLLDEEQQPALYSHLKTLERVGCESAGNPIASSAGISKSIRKTIERLNSAPKYHQHTRTEEDQFDLWLNALITWLEEVFESEGMQFYASFSRVLYLTLLGLIAMALAWRIWRFRASRSQRAEQKQLPQSSHGRPIESVEDLCTRAREAMGNEQFLVAFEMANRAIRLQLEASKIFDTTAGLTNRQISRRAPASLGSSLKEAFHVYDHHVYSGRLEHVSTASFIQLAEDILKTIGAEQNKELTP